MVKITNEDMKSIYERRLKGERVKVLANEYGVRYETLSRKIKSYELYMKDLNSGILKDNKNTKVYQPRNSVIKDLISRIEQLELRVSELESTR